MSDIEIQETWDEIQNSQRESSNIEAILQELESRFPEADQFSPYDMEQEDEEVQNMHKISLQKWGLPRG